MGTLWSTLLVIQGRLGFWIFARNIVLGYQRAVAPLLNLTENLSLASTIARGRAQQHQAGLTSIR